MFPNKEDSFPSNVAAQKPVLFVGVTRPSKNLTLLPIVPMKIVIMEVYGLLDQGSEATLIDQRPADELGLEGNISQTQFHTFHNRDPVINFKEVSVIVTSLDQSSSFNLENCYTVPQLILAKRNFNWNDLQRQWSHLPDIELQDTAADRVVILIGMDNPAAHRVFASRYDRSKTKAPCAIQTPFGWCVTGPLHSVRSNYLRWNHLAIRNKPDLDVLFESDDCH